MKNFKLSPKCACHALSTCSNTLSLPNFHLQYSSPCAKFKIDITISGYISFSSEEFVRIQKWEQSGKWTLEEIGNLIVQNVQTFLREEEFFICLESQIDNTLFFNTMDGNTFISITSIEGWGKLPDSKILPWVKLNNLFEVNQVL